jgi:uncharacterized membrane protein
LPKKVILFIGIVLVAGHNLLDGIVMQGMSFKSIVWYILHQEKFLLLGPNNAFIFKYPIIPWVGLMALGYCFGTLYSKGFDATIRKKWLLSLGFGSIALFFILRGINEYGDLVPWSHQRNGVYTILSFFNTTKYPPSLIFLLMTIGPSLLFLYLIENVKNKVTDFFVVFGRVPLFFYFLHVLVIHVAAIIGILIFGGNWQDMILTADVFMNAKLINYGYPLYIVYLLWILLIIFLYPFCKKYMNYKLNHKEKWWLSYL